jgi:hypothetical protein
MIMTAWIKTRDPRTWAGAISFIKIGTEARHINALAPAKNRKVMNIPTWT